MGMRTHFLLGLFLQVKCFSNSQAYKRKQSFSNLILNQTLTAKVKYPFILADKQNIRVCSIHNCVVNI